MRADVDFGAMHTTHHHLRAALRAALDASLADAIDSFPAIVYVTTHELRPAVWCSERMEEVLGYPRERFLEEPGFWGSLVHPDDLDAAHAAYERSVRTLEPFDHEYRMRAADGTYHWFRDRAVFIEGDDEARHWKGVMLEITERKQTELRVRELEAKYRNLVEQLPAVTYLDALDEQHTCLYLSPQAEQLLGISPHVFGTLEVWAACLHPDDRDETLRAVLEHERAGEPFTLEYRMLGEDGREVWIRDTASVVRDASGEPVCIQGLYQDVTAERQQEAERNETLAKFQALVEQLPAAVYIEGADGSASSPFFLSRRYEDIFGYTVEERLADPGLWAAILHPDDREAAISAASRSAATGEPFRMDYRVVRKDGSVTWVHDETVLVRDAAGEPLFWQGIASDVTERKRTEEELRAAVRRFQSLAEQIPAVTYIEPLRGPVRPVYVSPQYQTMFGYSPEERLADPTLWERLLHPDDRERVLAEVAALDELSERWHLEYRMVHRSGRVVWVQDQAVLVRDDDGTALFYQGVLFDVTESKRAEEELQRALAELRRADEIKNTFLTAVSHDLRTPLATILGNAITLEHSEELGLTEEERRTMLRSLSAKARRLTELITDLLDMDRLTRGALEPRFAPEELGTLVSRVVRDADVAEDRVIQFDARPTVAMVDRSMVERIVENLLVNAVKHTPPSSTIWVRVRQVEAGAEVVVEDDGPGVPADLRETLFRPFERGPSANPQSPGAGLGLSLVARFAELHDGRAWVEERAGGGASFHVLLAANEQVS
jgi:PAS domain S-box-containing protein